MTESSEKKSDEGKSKGRMLIASRNAPLKARPKEPKSEKDESN